MTARTTKKEEKSRSEDAWQLFEDDFTVEKNLVQETLFSLGNGYLGLRGAHEERFPGLKRQTNDQTFINGFYESSTMEYPETAHAWAKQHQFMLNVPNGKCINFLANGENFDISQGTTVNYERSLDFRTGILTRNIEWVSPLDKHFTVTSQRMVSFPRKNLFAIQYEIKSINFEGQLQINSALDGMVKDEESDEPRYGAAVAAVTGVNLRLLGVEQNDDFSAMVHRTKNSGLALVSAIENELVFHGEVANPQLIAIDERVEQIFTLTVKAGDTIRLTKYGCYFTSRDFPESELVTLAKDSLQQARTLGFDGLCLEQKKYLADFWHHADIEVLGNEPMQQGIRFNEFHLLQSIGRDGRTSIAAKGLTGEGYGGHYFWDAEIFAFPFYLYSKPDIARKMLEYRFMTIGKARDRAREMSHKKGALFSWRTIAGEECSAFFPSGTAQYHINADIAYAVKLYYEATEDEEFLTKYGAEIVMETARIWMDLGAYIARKNNKFCINAVTGPDEYTVLVDNNFYTNAMAQMHLSFAAGIAAKLKTENPEEYRRISEIMQLNESEPAEWLRAAKSMNLPYDDQLGIHPQDDTFLSKKIWNPAETPREPHLPLHHHYLVIYRHQVCKQADVVLAMFLLGDRFNLADKKRDYDYYEPITTHDSSLSYCTFSVIASEIGYGEQAYDHFMQTARMDLDNIQGNSSYGVHVAAMGGTWMAIVHGFAGMRAYNGKLSFAPYLPSAWQAYSFKILFKGQLLHIQVDTNEVRYRLLTGEALEFEHDKLLINLTKDYPIKVVPTNSESGLGKQSSKQEARERVDV